MWGAGTLDDHSPMGSPNALTRARNAIPCIGFRQPAVARPTRACDDGAPAPASMQPGQGDDTARKERPMPDRSASSRKAGRVARRDPPRYPRGDLSGRAPRRSPRRWSRPLIDRRCWRRTAHRSRLPRLDEIHFRTASDAELARILLVTRYLMENADAQLQLMSDVNTKALTGIDPARMARAQGARRDLLRTFMERDSKPGLSAGQSRCSRPMPMPRTPNFPRTTWPTSSSTPAW